MTGYGDRVSFCGDDRPVQLDNALAAHVENTLTPGERCSMEMSAMLNSSLLRKEKQEKKHKKMKREGSN